jgi:hypothetical protein
MQRESPKLVSPIANSISFLILLACIGILGFRSGLPAAVAEDKAPAAEIPLSALIVPEAIHLRAGIGETKAISIVDRATIAKLAALFPKFERQPSSDVAGAWEAGYVIYFNFKGNRVVRVILSVNDDGQTWSTGDGDFKTHGDFRAFLDAVRPKSGKDTKE